MDEAPDLKSQVSVVQVGIRGLPGLAGSMVAGGLYVLIAKTTSARFPMFAGSVAQAIEDGVTSTVISANPAQFIQRIEAISGIDAAELVNSRRLQFFMLQDNFLKKMFQFGARRFVSELEDFGVSNNSYLIFDQADELLSLHDVSLAHEQVVVLKEWFAEKGVTALLVFSRLTETHSSTLNAIMDSLNGIVRLGAEKEGLTLRFDYWQSPASVVVGKSYHLTVLESGLYEASGSSSMAVSLLNGEGNAQQLWGRHLNDSEIATPFFPRPAAAFQDACRGYLRPIEFLRELERMLDRTTSGSFRGTLVVGVLVQGFEMGDVISRYDRSARFGEILTADNQHCYIYQSVDSKSTALENLHMILGLPVGALLNVTRLASDADEIRMLMGALMQAIKRGDCPEYVSVHDVSSPLQASGATQSAGAEHLLNYPQGEHSILPVFDDKTAVTTDNGENILLLNFEPAARSQTPAARIYDRSEAFNAKNIYAQTKSSSIEDVVFDVEEDMYGAVFGKTEAPRAKRSHN